MCGIKKNYNQKNFTEFTKYDLIKIKKRFVI